MKLVIASIWAGGLWLFANGYGALALIAPGMLYVGHLRMYPNKRCPAQCTGGHVYSTGLFSKTSHPCGRCGGSGRVKRLGSSIVSPKDA